MTTWKTADYIIFDLSGILYTSELSNCYKLFQDSEKLLFSLIEHKVHTNNLYLVSDYNDRELAIIIKMLGLDFYFKHIISSESVGYRINNINFWRKYCEKLAIEPSEAVLISNNYITVDSVLQLGFKKAVLLRNNKFSDIIEKKNLLCVNQLADLVQSSQLELASLA